MSAGRTSSESELNGFDECDECGRPIFDEMNGSGYRVYWRVPAGKKKTRKVFHDGWFAKRQQARQWCRNHARDGLVIVRPDGTEEAFAWTYEHEKWMNGLVVFVRN